MSPSPTMAASSASDSGVHGTASHATSMSIDPSERPRPIGRTPRPHGGVRGPVRLDRVPAAASPAGRRPPAFSAAEPSPPHARRWRRRLERNEPRWPVVDFIVDSFPESDEIDRKDRCVGPHRGRFACSHRPRLRSPQLADGYPRSRRATAGITAARRRCGCRRQSGCRCDAAVERFDPVDQPTQAGAVGDVGATDAVVGHLGRDEVRRSPTTRIVTSWSPRRA